MTELRQELVVIVAADDVMRHRNANRGRGLDGSVGSWHQLQQARPHDGNDSAQLGDHDLGFEIGPPFLTGQEPIPTENRGAGQFQG